MIVKRILRGAGAVVLVAAVLPIAGASAHSLHALSAGKVTAHETVERTDLDNGHNHVVDRRSIRLEVGQTKNLRGRQEINVSWTGAHPTGGIVADQNSIDAQQEEYPFVLLECRGTSSHAATAADRLSPRTCWTQDWSERYQDSYSTNFPPYRLDRYASTQDRAQVAGAPRKIPSTCYPAPTQHWVPFISAGGHVYEDGPGGCDGQPPGSQATGGAALPSNETFGVTGLDGRGNAKFDIFTETENAPLGCSQSVPCSLVAVPIMGISCDPDARGLPASDRPSADQLASVTAACESTGNFAPGQLVTPQGGDALAVSGSLWWSQSNWRNRIVVPLSFAVPDDACQVVSNNHDVQIYGSELLIQATDQWTPHFCLDSKLFDVTHVQTGEPEARNLVATGSAEAAFISDPPPDGYGRPVVNAPVAISGFAISYVIDGADGQPYTKLRLDPRLLAKLLTESYPADITVQDAYPALAHNPLNITDDPEFIKLNPGITHGVSASEAASALLALSSDSDVMEALTSYINDNPAARAWLNGRPDPWGMVVNPAYKHIVLPLDQWPLLSTFEPKAYYASGLNQCLKDNPVPYLPLVAAPQPALEDVTQDLQFSDAQSTTVCSDPLGNGLGEKLVAEGRQTVGHRFMIGVTSIAEAKRYGLDMAALSSSGAHFVRPTDSSLRAATALLSPDETTGTWPIPYDKLRSSAAAYPGTMIVYTALPTSGLPAEDARDYAAFLDYVTGPGQRPGDGVGQLADGYLPMTSAADGAALASYTQRASAAVAHQTGKVVPLIAPRTTPTSTPSGTAPTRSTPQPVDSNGNSVPSTYPTAPTTAATSPTSSTPTAGSTSPAPASTQSTSLVADAGSTPDVGLGGSSALAWVALVLLAGLIAVPVGWFAPRWLARRGRRA